MRIIAGEFKSRKLLTPKDDSVTRPIPDRVKESLFGLLRGHCEGAHVFDAFAGTGAIGLEVVSRGAARCVFIEKDKGSADLLRRNIEALGAADRCEVVVGDALGPGAMARCPRPVTLAFFDPPYPLIRDKIGWQRVRAQFEKVIDCLTPDGFAVLRTPWPHVIEEPDPSAPAPVQVQKKRKKPSRDERHWRFRHHEEEATADPEIAEADESPAEESPRTGLIRTPATLEFPNARGPETHVYHAMAVHLYMRKQP